MHCREWGGGWLKAEVRRSQSTREGEKEASLLEGEGVGQTCTSPSSRLGESTEAQPQALTEASQATCPQVLLVCHPLPPIPITT